MGGAFELSADRERRIADEIARRRPGLRDFVRRRVADAADAEDILQDVMAELVQALRLPDPIEEVGAWLFRVARNRIVDRFRKKKPEALADAGPRVDPDDGGGVDELLPSSDAGPEAAYARAVLIEELEAALNELPPEQRDVFIAHELEGRSFNEIAAATGVGVNTLLSRKRYAVLHLRERLREIYDEFSETGDSPT